MNLKLTPQDYKKLWLLMTPEEIKEEFGDYSHSARHIRNYFSEFGGSKTKRSRQELKEKIEGAYVWQPGTHEITEEVLQEFKSQAIHEVWESIRKFI